MHAERSLFWPIAVAVGGFLVLIGLGTWQVQRLFWKEGLIAQRQAAVTAPPIAPPRSLAEARGLEYHRITATGRLQNDHELDLGATDDGGHPGYQVITPLVLDDGAVLLVDRGFVPEAKRAPASRPEGELAGEVAVTGLLRLAPEEKPHWFLPDNSPTKNYWLYVDIPAMARAAQQEHVLPYYLDADATPVPGGLPVGGQTRLDLPNNHLQYAITWYALAAALAVIAVLRIRQGRSGGDAS
ncbi:MAG TPA: SURF1 family protein [Stellaceae bacterium]|nr:SURF1 family protein [Stellaceae bacterium]